MQQLDRAQYCCSGGHGAKLEGIEEHRSEPVQHRPGTRGQCRQVHFVRAGEAFGFGDAFGELFPADGRTTAPSRSASPLALAAIRAAPSLAKSRTLSLTARASRRTASFLADLGAAEHPADGTVEQADAVIGQPRRGIQHGRDQSGPATKR